MKILSKDTVIIPDNDRRNSDVLKSMKKIFEDGYPKVLFFDDIQEKDINDMVMSGKTKEEIETIIKIILYQGNIAFVEVHKLEKSKCLTYQTHYQHNINSLFIYQDILDGCLKKAQEKLGVKL